METAQLQEMETVEDLDQEIEQVETEDGAESAPAKHPEGYVPEDKHKKAVNKQHFKYREEERARKKLEAQLAERDKRLAELEAKQNQIEIPPAPDPYDEDYAEKVKARDEALLAHARNEAQQDLLKQDQEKQQEASLAQQQEALNAKIAQYDSNIVALGLNPLEIKQSADQLVDYGISETFQDIILEHEEGPLITQYLAQNPVELEEMTQMSPLQLVNHISTSVQPKASLLKPQISQAPAPPVEVPGGGVEELEDEALRGATFE